MKKLLTLAVLAACIATAGCQEDDTLSPYTYNEESSILYGSNRTNFKEVLFFIKPYTSVDGQKLYLATDTLYNLSMKVNTLAWGTLNSLGIDTSAYPLQTVGNVRLSELPLSYPVVATYQTTNTKVTNAGQYANLVLNFQTLQEGEYLFRVESFEIKQTDGTTKKIPTPIVVPLSVVANKRSVYLGEFEVFVKL